MAFLHYRSAPFFIERSKQLPGTTPIYDMALSFMASSEDPISGGRHKVIGSKKLNIPPQTSTIASHLPKAVGTAFSIDRAKDLNIKELKIYFDPDFQLTKQFKIKGVPKTILLEKKGNESLRFNLRGYINKKFQDLGVQMIDNIAVDSFASETEYFSHRRAKKLGEDDYGRCISAIRKITL